MLLIEEPIAPDMLSLEPTPTDVTLTQPSLGDSEEVAPTYVQPNENNYPIDYVHLPTPENNILRSKKSASCPNFCYFGDEQKLITFNPLYSEGRRAR